MKNNYPIRYALIPMIEQVGWTHGLNELERDYDIVCYIVAKCYVIDDIKKYNQDGTVSQKYHVVCPYNRVAYQEYRKEEPTFNYIDGHCTNCCKVDELFTDIKEALKTKKIKNNELLLNNTSCLPYDKIEKEEEKFNKILTKYNRLEKEIEKYTSDLVIDYEPKEQSIIIISDDKIRYINDSLYFYLKNYYEENYIVYSLNKDDYANLKLGEDVDYNKLNQVPLLINNKECNYTKVISKENEYKYLFEQKIVDDIDFEYSDPSIYDKVIYTLEDYQDIIKSFNSNCKVLRLK